MSLTPVNQWPITDTGGYGPGQAAVTNTTGNTLVAYLACGSDNVNGYVPRMCIADDAHNWWIWLGSKTDPFAADVRRVDVWICPNAQAASVVSVAASMIYAGLAGSIVEFTGFPQFAQLDFISVVSASGTSATVPAATATGSDWTFSCLLTAGNSNGGIVSRPGTTLTPVLTASGLTDMSNLSIYPSYNSCNAGTVGPTTYSWNSSTNYTAIIVGLSQTPTTPAQPNPNWPALKVEGAFGFQPGNTSGAMPTWTDLTTRVIDQQGAISLKASRGREYELTAPEAGKLAMPLNNLDGAFNPENSGSPFFPNVVPEVPVRVSAVWQGRQYGIAYSYGQKWPQDFPDPQWGMTGYEGGDAIGIASQGSMPSSYQGEVLADLPQGAWSLGEFYGAASGFQFANYSRTNQKPMLGFSPGNLGATLQLQTGLQLGMAGDPSSGVGLSGLTSYSTLGGGGVYIRDANIPGGSISTTGIESCTYECWCVPTYGQPSAGLSEAVDILTLLGTPTNYPPITSSQPYPFNNGIRLGLTAWFNTPSSGNNFFTATLYGPNGNTICAASTPLTMTNASLNHLVIKTSYNGSGTWTLKLYWQGALVTTVTGTFSGSLTVAPINILAAGPVSFMGGSSNTDNYIVGQVAAYPWLVPDARIARHYANGSTADSGDPITVRLGRLFAWSGLGLPFGSTPSSVSPLAGNADNVQGGPLADSISNLAQDDGGMYYAPATAQGEIWYTSRQSLYNKTPALTFGDQAVMYLNQSWNFSGSTWQLWSVSNGNISQSTAFPFCGPDSLLMTGNGSATPIASSEMFPVQGNQAYACNPICMSPQGWASGGQIGINWYDSSKTFISTASGAHIALTANLPAVVPLGNQTSPSNAVYARVFTVGVGTPANTVQFFWAGAGLTLAGEIPYETDGGFDFSDTFLYNLVTSQRTISAGQGYITNGQGAASLQNFNNYGATADVANVASELEYFPRGPLQLDIETKSDQDAYDRANWSLTKYKQPQLRPNQIRLNPAANPSIFGAVLSIEQGDICTVNRRPIGAPMISIQCIVQQISHDIGPDHWETTLTFAPYFPENAVIQLDNSSFNQLADGTVLGW